MRVKNTSKITANRQPTISKGITLSYKAGEATEYTALTDLQEIPDMGGNSEAIEITTLDDAAHMYTDGILDYGDSKLLWANCEDYRYRLRY